MRVLILAPNRQRFVHPVPPIGALYIAAAARRAGHEVRVTDLMYSADPIASVKRSLAEFQPEVVGISIRNTDTLFSKDIYEIPQIKLYADAVRELTTAKLILGGAGYSFFAEELAGDLEADYGIKGEADRSFPKLLGCIAAGTDPASIAGLVYRKNGAFVSNPPDRVEDLDSIPFQAMDLIDGRAYSKCRANLGVFTRKGCPMDCIFCPEDQIHGHAVRLRSARLVVDEIEYLSDLTGVRYFDFADTLFNMPREHALAVCHEIIDRRVKIKFEVELNPLGQDDESVKLLKAAGCMGVDLTSDTGSETMLKNLRKGFTKELVMRAAGLYRKHGIPYTVGFLLGGPGENRSTVKETLDFIDALPGCSGVYMGVGIRVFKGTGLAPIFASEYGEKAEAGMHHPSFYVSPEFDGAAPLLIDYYKRNLGCYISDFLYEGAQLKAMKMADWMNIRPIWKHGKTPRIIDLLMHLGKTPDIAWDKKDRRFRIAAA
ncbi:MAG: radical SAM protein [Myxococcota bacterium]